MSENFERNIREKMKTFIRLAIFIIIIAMQYKMIECGKKMDLDGLKDMLKPMSKSCKTKTGATDEMVANVQLGQFPMDRSLMCYFRCLSIMLKLMNKQGQVSVPNVNKQIDLLVKEDIAARMKEITQYCYDNTPAKEDSCEYAFALVICCYNQDSSLYFLP